MCARFNLSSNLHQLALQLGLPFTPDFAPRYNLAPTNSVLTVLPSDQGRVARTMRWGLVPSWAADPKIGSQMINARSETVAEKPAFRSAFKSRRCLIPADGYYEWVKQGKRRIPYFIHRADRVPLCFAGLWETWKKGAEPLETCTILTTEANSLTRPLHDRMPVILAPADYDAWLAPEAAREGLQALLHPYGNDELQVDPVSDYVNKVGNEGEQCLAAPNVSD